jgi:hypothetical protein
VLVGEKTGALYWLDFERAALESAPRYPEFLAEHHRLVDQWFGLSLSVDTGRDAAFAGPSGGGPR